MSDPDEALASTFPVMLISMFAPELALASRPLQVKERPSTSAPELTEISARSHRPVRSACPLDDRLISTDPPSSSKATLPLEDASISALWQTRFSLESLPLDDALASIDVQVPARSMRPLEDTLDCRFCAAILAISMPPLDDAERWSRSLVTLSPVNFALELIWISDKVGAET